jgi:hypothetical protein
MPICKVFPVCCSKPVVVSLFIALVFTLLSLFSMRRLLPEGRGASYAVLSLDKSWSDSRIVGMLNEAGVETVISESSQWVFLDDFGYLRRFSPEEYRERLEPFDPRNDGYAERLHAFFVRDEKRLFFIPLAGAFRGRSYGWLKKNILSGLGDIPYSLEFLSSSGSVSWLFILFGAGAAGTLIFLFFSRGLARREPPGIVLLLPVAAPFALAGSPGFALSALFFGLFAVSAAPLREFFVSRRYGYKPFSPRAREIQGANHRFSWCLVALFLCVYGGISCFGSIPVAASGAGFVAFSAILWAVLWMESHQGKVRNHIRFLPVQIRRSGGGLSSFPRIVLPFALASLFALFLELPASEPAASGYAGIMGEGAPILSPADYAAHLAFQSSFSLRPLGAIPDPSANAGSDAAYPYLRYILGDDGLIAGSAAYDGFPETGEAPPFPRDMERLMEFLGGNTQPRRHTPGDLIPVMLVLVLGILPLFSIGKKYRNKKSLLVYTDKRVAA